MTTTVSAPTGLPLWHGKLSPLHTSRPASINSFHLSAEPSVDFGGVFWLAPGLKRNRIPYRIQPYQPPNAPSTQQSQDNTHPTTGDTTQYWWREPILPLDLYPPFHSVPGPGPPGGTYSALPSFLSKYWSSTVARSRPRCAYQFEMFGFRSRPTSPIPTVIPPV